MSAPRIGLLLPQYDCEIFETLEFSKVADREGLDLWIAGQIFPISSQPHKPAFEPLTLMGALAVATERSRLGFMVLAAPYLSPFYQAKALITLDHLSGGRLDVGLGAGWRELEFEAVDVEFGSGRSRRDRLEQAITVLTELAAGRPAPLDGDVVFASEPAAVQTPPPLWIAGRGPRILEVVGRRADWANFARGISVEDFRGAAAIVREAAIAAGRGDGGPKLSLTGTFLGARDADAVAAVLRERAGERGEDPDAYRERLRGNNALVGTPAEMADQLAPHLQAGAEAVILWPLDANHADAAATLAALRDVLAERSAA
jgi:alkanesulfonate monooxygenase SsuD/methylene tetrahydromethanopterin reductase-like flavin-dependent oxidoreductase (luciferase family)